MSAKPSLVDYAKASTRQGRPCSVCEHRLRDELDAAKHQRVGPTAMWRWLREHHDDNTLTVTQLNNHFARGHHDA